MSWKVFLCQRFTTESARACITRGAFDGLCYRRHRLSVRDTWQVGTCIPRRGYRMIWFVLDTHCDVKQ